jgi:hypothetical protein
MEYPAIRPYVTTPDDEFTEKGKYYNETFYYWHYF